MKKYLSVLMLFTLFMATISFGAEKPTYLKGIKNITSITEPSGKGSLLTAVAVEFNSNIKSSSLSKETFSIDGRTVTAVYVNNKAEKRTGTENESKSGKYVIIELSPDDAKAVLRIRGQRGDGFKMAEPDISVVQKKTIISTSGKKYLPGDTLMKNNKVREMIVEDFKQFVFEDPETGISLKYNLYIPKNYNKNKKYPLVLFMHDMGVLSDDTKSTLRQGNGATVWATSSEQKKHEAFVLAPQYNVQVVNDNHEVTGDLEATVNLLNSLMKKYSIDRNRLYTTGQSMGGMMSIVMNVRYPDLFAASYFVASQWDENVVAPMAKNNIWITVSTGDPKAFPGMNAITDVLSKNGGKVAKASWLGNYTSEQFNQGVKDVLTENANINYTTLEKGTIPGVLEDGREHNSTWTVAYNIEGIRDWIFRQKKINK